jgi:hypothetical protein
MKTWSIFILAALSAVGFGCRSNEPRVVTSTSTTTQQITHTAGSQQNAPPAAAQQEPEGTTIQQFTTNNVTYTIQSIPNSRLTPTSREGDKANAVYSSNIIAVQVRTNNFSTANPSNDATNPAPENK